MSDQIGKLITTPQERDAIHVAIAPVVAAERLAPGQHIGLIEGDVAGVSSNPIGIVDPFLAAPVFKGDRFFMVLYPNTVTGMRHQWAHPAFEPTPAPASDDSKAASIAWLTDYASNFDLSYDALIRAAKDRLEGGYYHVLGYDTPDVAYTQLEEFWKHFERVTGIVVDDRDTSVFTCAC